jgi:hypothetical protein
VTKNHIIQEIQRTARENGGQPLGRLKFLHVTGIKETDWSGKFWARWNDALKEAGFGPNRLQQAYEDSFLLDRFAGLVRELGRIPVVTEMRLKARADTSFPSRTVFERFGSKEKLIARVLDYVQQHDNYSDVVPIVSAAVCSNTTQDESSTQKIVTGFVSTTRSSLDPGCRGDQADSSSLRCITAAVGPMSHLACAVLAG